MLQDQFCGIENNKMNKFGCLRLTTNKPSNKCHPCNNKMRNEKQGFNLTFNVTLI